ncbi:MAG: hypothetical protein Q9M13_08495 [Mariprofundales bacterium]|nr:hypothetical protein [Mariprofundales bacterium]
MIASWECNGELLLAHELGERELLGDLACVEGVPQLEGEQLPAAAPRMVLLPLELLLLRAVQLPLSHPRFIDSAVLGQELEERAGVDAEQWWLAWQMDRLDDGCAGMLFAMSQAMQQRIAADPFWSQAATITTDGWVRLQAQLSAAVAAEGGESKLEAVAVVDGDQAGLFFGYWREGCWLGMRRLNSVDGQGVESARSLVVVQMVRSLRAMGWCGSAVVGRLDGAWREALVGGVEELEWAGESVDMLPARLDANVEAASSVDVTLNFRHGSWSAAASGLVEWRKWRRSALILLLIALGWYGQQQMAIRDLQQQSAQVEERVAAAFHRGLPDQAVMLDPLGQLQLAVEGVGVGVDRQMLLRQLASLAAVRQGVEWSISALQVQGGVVRLRGSTKDLKALNRLHEMLQQRVGSRVVIEDTDLRKESVGFRMRWS